MTDWLGMSDEVREFEGTGKLVGLLTTGVVLAGLMVAWFGVVGRSGREPATDARRRNW